MTRKRDLTREQFEARLKKEGFAPAWGLGYYYVDAKHTVAVSVWNAGRRRRDQLNYLLAARARHAAKVTA